MVVILFLIGAALGSALHAFVWRSHNNISFVRGRSCCDACGHALRWYELIPVASFFFCHRQCGYCRKPLRWSFLYVEMFTGCVVPLLYVFSNTTIQFAHHLITFVLLFLLFLSDWWYMEMPESILELTIVWGMTSVLLFHLDDVVRPFFTAAGIGGFFLLQYVASRGRWIGSGDIFFGIVMGLLLGWPLGVVALVLAYVVGALIGAGGVLLRRFHRHQLLPLGAFLAAATFIVHVAFSLMPQWFNFLSV